MTSRLIAYKTHRSPVDDALVRTEYRLGSAAFADLTLDEQSALAAQLGTDWRYRAYADRQPYRLVADGEYDEPRLVEECRTRGGESGEWHPLVAVWSEPQAYEAILGFAGAVHRGGVLVSDLVPVEGSCDDGFAVWLAVQVQRSREAADLAVRMEEECRAAEVRAEAQAAADDVWQRMARSAADAKWVERWQDFVATTGEDSTALGILRADAEFRMLHRTATTATTFNERRRGIKEAVARAEKLLGQRRSGT